MNVTPDPELMRIFDFTADDLEANRAGRITKHQTDHQYELLKKHNKIFLVAAIVIPVGFLLTMALTGAFSSSSPLNQHAGFYIVGLLGLSVMLISIMVHNDECLASDVKSGVAGCENGSVKRKTGRSEGYLKISNLELTLYETQDYGLKQYLKKMSKETPFRVYYIPKSKRVVAMEVIE